MSRVSTSLLLFFYTDFCIESLPIKTGFSVKFKPLSTKDEIHPKTFGSLFAKISQDFTPEAMFRQQIFSRMTQPPSLSLGNGCSNQIASLTLLNNNLNHQDNSTLDSMGYFKLPIIKQPFTDYKVLVATAPPDIKIGRRGNSENLVIYVVFNEESFGEDAGELVQAPEIYFVNKPSHYDTPSKDKQGSKSTFIMNNNRTVTGLKSNKVVKVIKFKNKLTKDFD